MEHAEILAQNVEVIVVRDVCCQIWTWNSSEWLSYMKTILVLYHCNTEVSCLIISFAF